LKTNILVNLSFLSRVMNDSRITFSSNYALQHSVIRNFYSFVRLLHSPEAQIFSELFCKYSIISHCSPVSATHETSQPFTMRGKIYCNFVYFDLSVAGYSMERQKDIHADPDGNKNILNVSS